jgi:RNA polymerase sigma factor (sigma-70 family)
MISALTRIFGLDHLAMAEDAVQEAFLRALEIWKFRGPPENPSAWLMAAAKNRALDVLRRERTSRRYAAHVGQLLESEWSLRPMIDDAFEPRALADDLLRMMFSCCHPRLREPAQVALILHLLCGFSVDEIASAFMASHAAIERRVSRAKAALAGTGRLAEVTDGRQLARRLPAVHRALYLLFNEGYHSAGAEAAVRAELCHEAVRLTELLVDHPAAGTPETLALAALLHLHLARLSTRLTAEGDFAPFAGQDRSHWDREHMARGSALLERAFATPVRSAFHLEAAIACEHAVASHAGATNWGRIVSLYDILLTLNPSPVVALSRAIAVAQHEGPARGLAELDAISDAGRLAKYPFYAAARGELELALGHRVEARAHFDAALASARNAAERRHFAGRAAACAPATTEAERAQPYPATRPSCGTASSPPR